YHLAAAVALACTGLRAVEFDAGRDDVHRDRHRLGSTLLDHPVGVVSIHVYRCLSTTARRQAPSSLAIVPAAAGHPVVGPDCVFPPPVALSDYSVAPFCVASGFIPRLSLALPLRPGSLAPIGGSTDRVLLNRLDWRRTGRNFQHLSCAIDF